MPTLTESPTWVYEAYDDEGTLLYVGVAVDIDRRLAQHAATKNWWPMVCLVDAARYEDRTIALTVESHAILTRSPLYNVQGAPASLPYEPIGRRHYSNHPAGLHLDGVQREWR